EGAVQVHAHRLDVQGRRRRGADGDDLGYVLRAPRRPEGQRRRVGREHDPAHGAESEPDEGLHRGSREEDRRPSGAGRAGARAMIIDGHAHYLPHEVARNTSFYRGAWTDLDGLLRAMDEAGVDRAVLLYPTSDAHRRMGGLRGLCNEYNTKLARVVRG